MTPVPREPSVQEYVASFTNPDKFPVPSSAPVEVHLSRELSNPHSRAKKQKRWQEKQIRAKELLEDMIQTEYENLAGRTKRVARAEATWKCWPTR